MSDAIALARHFKPVFASFERQNGKVRHAIRNTLKFGSSPKVTFLKKAFFD